MRVLLLILALLASPAQADGWQALREPGTIALMRHALAPGTGDPARFRIDDCATQRNLDASGRAQARAIGAAFRAEGISVDRVLTSQWCRCRETARLLELGPFEDFEPLNSFFGDRSTAAAQTAETAAYLAKNTGEKLVLVTHQVNMTALTGAYPSSGEIFVVRAAPDGRIMLVDTILIDP